jgi:ferric-dicitrate binding protein FerR (iron transport regulator)
MNVMDRSFPARAEKAKAEFKARRRRAVMLGLAAILIMAAAAFYVVWAFTLCGDCSGPATLPPPA